MKLFLQIIFFLMLMKEYVFVSRNFLLLHKLKKGRRLNLCQLFTCWTLVEPSQMIPAILVDQLQQGKEASVSRNIVHLFVSKPCWPQAQQYLVPLLGYKKKPKKVTRIVSGHIKGFCTLLCQYVLL